MKIIGTIVFNLFMFGVFAWLGYTAFNFVVDAKKTECDKWGGDYSWQYGCIMKYDNQMVMLNDYKDIIKTQYVKPIPTNQNISVGIK
jgi:hypothetical protein